MGAICSYVQAFVFLHNIPFKLFVMLNIGLNIGVIPDLQLPREIEIIFVFEINMQTAIAFFVAQVPVF